MKIELYNGNVYEVDTRRINSDRYWTVEDGVIFHDTQVKRVIDDIRAGEIYCSGDFVGSYDEVKQKIAEERSRIKQCDQCWWYQAIETVNDECKNETVIRDGKRYITKVTVHKLGCGRSGKCAHDISEDIKLFKDTYNCFFLQYPNGVPDQKGFKNFLFNNLEKYNLTSNIQRPVSQVLVKCKGKFGSYEFSVSPEYHVGPTETSVVLHYKNARNQYEFFVDLENKKFIIKNHNSYEVADFLGEWTSSPITGRRVYIKSKNFDKFEKWFWKVVDDFKASTYYNETA